MNLKILSAHDFIFHEEIYPYFVNVGFNVACHYIHSSEMDNIVPQLILQQSIKINL